MKNFKQLIKELPSKKVVFAFGRFQPPTTGHELLVKAVKKLAGSTADHVIYASKSEDKKSNPLPVARKVYFLKRMFPKTNFVAANAEVRTFIEAAKELNKKYKNIVMVAGSDRVAEYEKILNKYNGTEFNFDTVEVVSAGERDPDSDSASGMSGTKMREAAKAGDFKLFKKGVPHTLTDLDARRLMNDIRVGLGLEIIKENVTFDRPKIREQYVAGKIFNVGDKVKDENGTYEIMDRGTNYITVVNEAGELSKKWIDKVTSVKNVKEDIQGGYAPEEISFKGYTTKNLHHAGDAAKAFQSTINKYEGGIIKDGVAILNALKSTDEYMKLNDLHLEQDGKAPDETEVNDWVSAHMKAKESLERIGEFLHHMDYWDDHGHELQMLLTNYSETGKGDFADSFEIEGNMVQEELKFAAADKVKVARIIAATFGVENAEKGTSPEQLVNNGLRKIRNKAFTPDMAKVVKNMLDTARLAGIDFDEKLLPSKVAQVAEANDYTVAKDIMRYTDYVKIQKASKTPVKAEGKKPDMEQDRDDMDPNDPDDKVNQSDMDASDVAKEPVTKTGSLMNPPFSDDENLRRQKIRYRLGEGTVSFKDIAESTPVSEEKNIEVTMKSGHKFTAPIKMTHKDWHIVKHPVSKKQYRVDHKGNTLDEEITLGEGVDKNHPIVKEYDSLKKNHDIKSLRGLIKTQHKIIDTSEFRTKDHAISHYLRAKHGDKKVAAAFGLKEETISEAINADHYTATSEKSQFGGHRPHVVHKETGKTMHLAQHSYKSPEHAKKHAQAYLDAYERRGANSASDAGHSYAKTHKSELHEETVDEAHKLGDKVTITKGSDAGKTGTVGEIRHGAYKGAPKTFTIDHSHDDNGNKQSVQLKKTHFKSFKESVLDESHVEFRLDHREKVSGDHKSTFKDHEAKVTDQSDKATYISVPKHKADSFKRAMKSKHGASVDLNEDVAASDYTIKKTVGSDGETRTRKVHPRKVTFAASKKNAEPAQPEQQDEEVIDLTGKKAKKEPKKGEPVPTVAQSNKPFDAFSSTGVCEETEDKEEDLSDAEIDHLIKDIDTLEDIIDVYDDHELEYVDTETGEVVKDEELKEETLDEVMSRQERMRAKIRFMKTSAKRKRAVKISLKSHSSTEKINARARRLAINLIKQRIAKKPLNTLSVGEKERLERIIQKRKKVIARVAMKLTARVRKIENDRINHKKK